MAIPKRNGLKQTPLKASKGLKNGGATLKRTALKAKSLKLAQNSREYAKVCEQLKTLANGVSEYSGLKSACYPMVCHHICGRTNSLLLDPFNIIVCKQPEHEEIHEHNSFEQKQRLLALVKEIRLRQGFKFSENGGWIFAPDTDSKPSNAKRTVQGI